MIRYPKGLLVDAKWVLIVLEGQHGFHLVGARDGVESIKPHRVVERNGQGGVGVKAGGDKEQRITGRDG
jgi:hypothetical protein